MSAPNDEYGAGQHPQPHLAAPTGMLGSPLSACGELNLALLKPSEQQSGDSSPKPSGDSSDLPP